MQSQYGRKLERLQCRHRCGKERTVVPERDGGSERDDQLSQMCQLRNAPAWTGVMHECFQALNLRT